MLKLSTIKNGIMTNDTLDTPTNINIYNLCVSTCPYDSTVESQDPMIIESDTDKNKPSALDDDPAFACFSSRETSPRNILISKERLEQLEFLEKNISTIIKYEVYKSEMLENPT